MFVCIFIKYNISLCVVIVVVLTVAFVLVIVAMMVYISSEHIPTLLLILSLFDLVQFWC